MSAFAIGATSIIVIVLSIYAGMHVPIVLALVSFVGVWLLRGNFEIAVRLLEITANSFMADHVFAVIPLFVLMGLLVSSADIGRDAYQVANQAFRNIKGGLGIATVAANAIFAAITGTSIASAAVFSRISVPEMLKFGYKRPFAVGVVAGSSVLGMLIPPSVLLIVYALLAEVSIGDMFLAGILPGLLLSTAFSLLILFMAWFTPSWVRDANSAIGQDDIPILGGREILAKLLPIVVLIIIVLGGIYGGVFTATEAGAAGALAAFIIALVKRKLSFKKLWEVLVETGHISASIMFLLIAAQMYSRMLGLSGLPSQLNEFVIGLDANFAMLLTVYIILLLILGTIIDSISIMLITVPLMIPLVAPFDVNLIWFGIVTVVATEIGLLTPPLGITCYVVKSTLEDYGVTLVDVFKGAFPFALVMFLVLLLLIAFPGIALAFL